MRTLATRARAINQYNGLGNQLWDLAGNRPSLDLRFAESKSLVDATTGTNLIDFTRASSGTYVGSDGLIKKATTNLLLRSEEFDNASWTQTGVLPFGSGSIVNAIAAPNGSSTADLITENTDTSTHWLTQGSLSFTSGLVYTVSCFVKRATGTRNAAIQLRAASFSGAPRVNIDLTTGETTITGTGATVGSQSYGNGWWRVWVIATATSTVSSFIDIGLLSGTTLSYTGDGTSGIYIWGAQLEQSSTVGEYVKTTSAINSAPRFDHDPTTRESLGLLVEESRTNLVLQSQALTTSPWGDSAATTSLASTITDVFGGTSASFKLTEDNTNASHFVGQAFTLAASTSYSVTAWFKQGSANRDGRILLTNVAAWNGAVAPRARIEFSTGTVQAALGFTSTSLVRYSNGWYRFTGTALTSASGGVSALRLLVSDGNESYQGDGTSFVYLGPCQLEVGSFSTSYIPTVGAGVITPGYTTPAVTRAADVASISGANFSSWYRQDAGTVFVEGAVPVGVSSSRALLSIDDGTNNERIQIRHNSTTARTYVVADNGSVQFNAPLVTDSFPPGEYRKLAMAVKANDFAAVVDDAGTVSTGTGTMPTPTQLQIGNGPSNPQPCKPIKRLTYWPARLPNETLKTITN